MGLLTAAQAAGPATVPDAWWTALLALLGSSVLGGVLTAVLANLRAAAVARRDGYAEAVKTLIARVEYAYRIRRRVSDEPEALAALATRGNDLQEQLAACRTWVTAEHREVGRIYDDVLTVIDATVRPAAADAWNQAPITTAAGMALGGWGPENPWPHLRRLQRAIAYRFGWRRGLPAPLWRL